VEDVVNAWRGRSVLVTGATGLVGGWLVRRLIDEGAEVTCVVRDMDPQSLFVRDNLSSRTSVISGVVEDLSVMQRAVVDHEIEVIFHLAAQTIVGSALRNPFECITSNVLGTTAVLEAARLHSDLVQAIIVASSDKAYGTSDTLPYVEDMPLAGQHPYDVSKSCTDLISSAFHHSYGIPVGIARCGNIFGGGDLNWSRLIPGTMRSLIAGETPVLRSDGQMRREFLYARDAVDAYVQLALRTMTGDVAGEAFNFSDQTPMTVLEMYKQICLATVHEYVEPRVLGQGQNEITDQYLDSTKARQVLAWAPKSGLTDGLEETADWYRTYWKG
jgi:CDP-glucose 4,6-dehydratase